jgi:hypothetical protein
MRRFQIRHLLLVTTGAAIAFAVARLLDYESILTAFAIFAVFAPFVCYCIAAVAAATKRSMRQAVRYSLLAGTLGTFAATCFSIYGAAFLLPLLVLLFVFWAPQLILLEICSAYRSALVGSQF